MNTIKLTLAESGTIAILEKDFPLYKGSYQNKLLDILVPKNIIAPYIYGQNETTGAVSSSTIKSTTAVKVAMAYIQQNGLVEKSENFYLTFLKDITINNVEYALYERQLPYAFTLFAGQGVNAPKLITNVVNIQTDTTTQQQVINQIVTTQICGLAVLDSLTLDKDPTITPSELAIINGEINNLVDKTDKTNTQVATNTNNITTNTTNIAKNTTDIAKNTQDIANVSNKLDNEIFQSIVGFKPVSFTISQWQLISGSYRLYIPFASHLVRQNENLQVLVKVLSTNNTNYEDLVLPYDTLSNGDVYLYSDYPFTGKALIGGGIVEIATPTELRNKADIDLNNVDFTRATRFNNAVNAIANRHDIKPIEAKTQLYDLGDLTQNFDFNLDTHKFLLMRYQMTSNNQELTQMLPPLSDDRTIIFEKVDSTGVSNTVLKINPDGTDFINEANTPITITENGIAGVLFNAGNTWEWIPYPIMHENGLVLSDDKNNIFIGDKNIKFNKSTLSRNGNDIEVTLDNMGNAVKIMDGDKEVYNKILEYDITTGKITVVDKE